LPGTCSAAELTIPVATESLLCSMVEFRKTKSVAKLIEHAVKTVGTRVSPKEREAIAAAAAREHRTVSGWVMALIYTALSRPPASRE
jgi:hypothetical protein